MRSKNSTGGMHAARLFIRCRRIGGRLLPWILAMSILFCLIRIRSKIAPATENACRYACRQYASEIIAKSVSDTLTAVSHSDLTIAVPIYDASGAVSAIHINSTALNTMQTMLLENLNTSFEMGKDAAIMVPVGTLSGLYSLAGRGPEISLRFSPASAVEVKLHSDFAESGINQTVHRITAEITVCIACTVPLYRAEETMQCDYLLAETVIIGDVPDISRNSSFLPAA